MTRRSLLCSVTVLVLVSGALGACSQGPEDSAERFSSAAQPILGGIPADEAKYDAGGALVVKIARYGDRDFNCSGTLIGARVVLTAKHCVEWIDFAEAWHGNAYFAFGSNAWKPEQRVKLKSYVAAPPSSEHPGLLLTGGRDLAVVYLDEEPKGIEPAKPGLFEPSLLGTEFEIAGYGISDTYGSVGYKFVGLGSTRALEGRWYEFPFGSWDAYDEWYWTDSVSSWDIGEEALWWDLFTLEPGYELLAAGLEGEAVGCYGDPGGAAAPGQ